VALDIVRASQFSYSVIFWKSENRHKNYLWQICISRIASLLQDLYVN